ncbi:MAG: MazG nucleotide pyrophosphohydrolase domain-containing protein [Candidatus Njordarchaeia archaeon]
MLTLKEAQEIIKEKFFETDSKRGVLKTFLWLVEEIGELAEALRKEKREEIFEEIADVFAWTTSLANLLDIDLEEAFKSKYLGE